MDQKSLKTRQEKSEMSRRGRGAVPKLTDRTCDTMGFYGGC